MDDSGHPNQDENILINPLPELRAALASCAFGITSHALDEAEGSSYPLTEQEVETVRAESRKSGRTSERVVGRAKVVLRDGDGVDGEGGEVGGVEIGIRLDRSGWTIESASVHTSLKEKEGRTYESLETLLIDISPAYSQAMNEEIWKRFGMTKGRDQLEGEDGVE